MSADFYFQRFGFCPRQIGVPPAKGLGIIVVIPCFSEPDLISCLESLWRCQRPACPVEVIVTVNSSSDSPLEVRAQNEQTLTEARSWAATRAEERFQLHLIHVPDLPPKHAGVGLARKIGMDEALGRFAELGKTEEGIIACLDADCQCAPNYLVSLEKHFQEYGRAPGCSIYFEHPLEGSLDPLIYQAVAEYELHLRYYIQALRYSGFPHAFHTIGSCMAVRASAYRKQGGMNKRQAGEDFYFLHKIIPLGGYTELTDTIVFPSPRPSDRVPFGTGKAVRDQLQGAQSSTYPLQAFLDLKNIFHRIPAFYHGKGIFGGAPTGYLAASMRSFLEEEGFCEALAEIRKNTSSESSFRHRFFRWFNAFRTMKFIHHARDHFYGEALVNQESRKLIERLCPSALSAGSVSTQELLLLYRQLDRSGKRG